MTLFKIWLGNFFGICLVILIALCLPSYPELVDGAAAIMDIREATGFFGSFLLAIPCGMLMYMAVSAPDNPMRLFYVCMCVLAFIKCGFYHCVADMFYTVLGAHGWRQWLNIIPVTLGNFIGCNLIPAFIKILPRSDAHSLR